MGRVKDLWQDTLNDIQFRFLAGLITLTQAKRELGDLGFHGESLDEELDDLLEAKTEERDE